MLFLGVSLLSLAKSVGQDRSALLHIIYDCMYAYNPRIKVAGLTHHPCLLLCSMLRPKQQLLYLDLATPTPALPILPTGKKTVFGAQNTNAYTHGLLMGTTIIYGSRPRVSGDGKAFIRSCREA